MLLPDEERGFTPITNQEADAVIKFLAKCPGARELAATILFRRTIGRSNKGSYTMGVVEGITNDTLAQRLRCDTGSASRVRAKVAQKLGLQMIGDGKFQLSHAVANAMPGTALGTVDNRLEYLELPVGRTVVSATAPAVASTVVNGPEPAPSVAFVALQEEQEVQEVQENQRKAMHCVARPPASGEPGLRIDQCEEQDNAPQNCIQQEPGQREEAEGRSIPGFNISNIAVPREVGNPPAPLNGWEAEVPEIPESIWQAIYQGFDLDASLDPSPAKTSGTTPTTSPSAVASCIHSAHPVSSEVSLVEPSPAVDAAPVTGARTGARPPQPQTPTPNPTPARSAAECILSLYNVEAVGAMPDLFPAVNTESADGRFILDRLANLFEAEPYRVEDLEAIIKALPHDAFLQGRGKVGYIWHLRFLCVQPSGRLIDQGERARRLLKAIAKRGTRPEGAPTSTSSAPGPLTSIPIHRLETGTTGANQLDALFGDSE